MSHKVNEVWVEAAQEHFEGAIAEGNYNLALDVIADTRDKGFTAEAQAMREQLRTTDLSKFAIKSPVTL